MSRVINLSFFYFFYSISFNYPLPLSLPDKSETLEIIDGINSIY